MIKCVKYLVILFPILAYSQEWNRVINSYVGSGEFGTFAVIDNSLYVTGGITEIEGVVCEDLMRYDGVNWHPLGVGCGGGTTAFTKYHGNIFITGGFNDAGGSSLNNKLAYYSDSNGWGGFGWNAGSFFNDSKVYKDKLFAVGKLSSNTFGLIDVQGILQYDGLNLSSLTNGPGLNGGPLSVQALAVYDSLLLVGGFIYSADNIIVNNLAAWDGAEYSAFAGGVNSFISTLFVDSINEYLYVSGSFTVVGGNFPVSYFAKWDGANWFDIDGGVSCSALAMELYHNQLYIGGCFDEAGGKPIKYIARYNGTEWDSLGASINNQGASTLAVFQDELYVGGGFTQIGDTVVPGLAKWSFPLDSACQDMYAGIGAHPDTIYTGQLPYTFRSGCYGNGSLLWEFSDGFTSSKGHTAYDFNNTPGIYDIMLTAQCGTYTDTVYSQVVIVSNVGIEKVNQIELKIYPNPSDGKISIFSEQLNGQEVQISIFDIQGKEFYTKRTRFVSNTEQLDLNLPKGSYQISLKIEGKVISQTLVIE